MPTFLVGMLVMMGMLVMVAVMVAVMMAVMMASMTSMTMFMKDSWIFHTLQRLRRKPTSAPSILKYGPQILDAEAIVAH